MLIYVTNRLQCTGNFLERIERLAKGRPDAIILREKDLELSEYEALALDVQKICERHGVGLILHNHASVALALRVNRIHFSLEKLRGLPFGFSTIGASVHSAEEAEEAQRLGATYLVAGHIFDTQSKAGAPPRGLSFLRELCSSVTLPVYAIGGIGAERVADVMQAGACGVCIMGETMSCSKPEMLAQKFFPDSV